MIKITEDIEPLYGQQSGMMISLKLKDKYYRNAVIYKNDPPSEKDKIYAKENLLKWAKSIKQQVNT